jgi:muramidase (phage lysozyme)
VSRVKFLENKKNIVGILLAVSLLGVAIVSVTRSSGSSSSPEDPLFGYANPALVMQDGDPYIRALMRTISTSEANDRQPYSLLYGGGRAKSLDRHPSICVKIRNGPNKNNCSTAAGRYQTINTTWAEIAKRYGASQSGWFWDRRYSFAPIEQDRMVHAWLSDRRVWGGMDIQKELRQGNLTVVLKRLSSTWTSLGYGIETNQVTSSLPKVYAQFVQEELERSPQSSPQN